jgi:polysaccharide biosynthesis PFTS motif protein
VIIEYLTKSDLLIYDKYIIFYGSLNRKKVKKNDKGNGKTLVILMDDCSNIAFDSCEWKNTVFKKFTQQATSFSSRIDSNTIALKIIGKIYKDLDLKKKIPRYMLAKVYDNSQIELCYKKFIINTIRELLVLDKMIMELLQCNENSRIDLHLSIEMQSFIEWLKTTENDNLINNLKSISLFNERFVFFKKIFIKLIWSLKILLMPFYILVRIKKIDLIRVKNTSLKMILHTFDSDWGLHNNAITPSIDWPISKGIVASKNTIFISDAPISKERKNEFDKYQYKFKDLSSFNRVSVDFIFSKMLYSWVLSLPHLLKDLAFGDAHLLEVSTKGMYVFYQWSLFLTYYNADDFLCYQGVSIKDVFRNIVLKSNGCSVWRYDHTFGLNYNIYINKGKEVVSNVDLSFLNYTNEIHWGCLNTKAFANANSYSENHITIKPIWNYIFKGLSSRDVFDSVFKEGRLNHRVVISVFNSSFASGAFSDKDRHLNFLIALNEMLASNVVSNLDAVCLVKGKYPLEKYRELNDKNLDLQVERLLSNSCVIEVENEISPTAVIKISNMVISMAYTSTCVEALMMGKRAVYFDWNVDYPYSVFQQFDCMVASNSDELIVFFKYWIEMSDASFLEFLNVMILPFYQGECDMTSDLFSLFKDRESQTEILI